MSAAEMITLDALADAIGKSKATVSRRASDEGWGFEVKPVRGGRSKVFDVATLPPDIQAALARQAATQAGSYERPRTPAGDKGAGPPPSVSVTALPDRHLRKMEAKAAIVRAWHAYRDTCGTGREQALTVFVQLYNSCALDLPDWVTAARGKISKNSVRNWDKAFTTHGLSGLAPRYGNRERSGILDRDQDMQLFVIGFVADRPHVSAALVYEGLKARFPDRSLPSLRSVQRFIGRWKRDHRQLFAKVADPDGWRSMYKAAGGSRSDGVVRLNQLWELDSTPADLLLADGQRHNLVGVIDIYTRRLKLLVSRTSSAAAVAAALRGAILDWGVPETVRIDNGADYTSRHMRRAYDALAIETDICPPFTPEAKPHIERAFRTFSHGLLEAMPGFVGHNVAERKAIEARKSFAQRLMSGGETLEMRVTPEELQAFCDKWCDAIYHHNAHTGLGGQTPYQMAAAWTAPVRRIENDRALDVLLSKTAGDGWRVVTKKGIRIDGATFDHQALGGLEGERVQVLFDEADYGFVYVFSDGGDFVARAMCPERVGVSRQEVAAARKARQSEAMAEGMAALRAAKKAARPDDIVNDILTARAEMAEKLVAFPGRCEDHTTPALTAAADAAKSDEAPTPPARTPDDQARHTAMIEDLAAHKRADPWADKRARVERGLDIERRLSAGQAVSADDRRWFEGYRQHPEFVTQKEMIAEFGRLVL